MSIRRYTKSNAGRGRVARHCSISLVVFRTIPLMPRYTGIYRRLTFGEVDNREQTNYPVTLVVFHKEALELCCGYSRSQLDDAAAEILIQHLVGVLKQLSESATRRVGDIDWLSDVEQQQLSDVERQ